MKRFSLIAVIVLILVFFFDFRPALAQTLKMMFDSKPLADCSDSELALRYQDAARLAVNEGKTNEAIQIKKRISEEIGERGAKEFARNRGWEPILTKAEKSTGHPQGFDQVWRSVDGKIHVLEAKGGGSRPSGKQGTIEWCIDAAERTLKNHAATEAEKSAARTVIKEISKGNVDIYVIQTQHVQGLNRCTICKGVEDCSEEMISLAKDWLSRNTAHSLESGAEALGRNAAKTVEAAASGRYSGSWNAPVYEYPAPEPELPSFRSEYPVETQSNSFGNAMKSTTRTNERGAARAAEAASKGVSKAAKSATKTLTKASTAAEVATGIGVVVDAGFRAKDAYDTEQRYYNGEIDSHERVVSHVKNGAGMVGGWGGAAAGGYAGATGGAMAGAAAGSVVPVVGTAIGGAVGSVVGGIGGAIGGYFFGEKAAEAGVDCADGYFYGR